MHEKHSSDLAILFLKISSQGKDLTNAQRCVTGRLAVPQQQRGEPCPVLTSSKGQPRKGMAGGH